MLTADLKGKKAIVTGAASGIGLATAELLARSGATVAINDIARNPRLNDEVSRLCGEGLNVIAAPGDVGDGVDARAMVTTAAEAMGGVDYLVNNAGTPGTKTLIPPSDLDAQTEEFWSRLLSVNLVGPFRCTHAAAPYLRASKGAVVNTASTSGYGGGGSSSAYSCTKAGLINLTRELARGLAPDVRVNAIAPGIVNSDWECRFDEDLLEGHVASMPLQRAGDPEDYAEVILFLCAGAAYVTGQTITVDGGLRA